MRVGRLVGAAGRRHRHGHRRCAGRAAQRPHRRGTHPLAGADGPPTDARPAPARGFRHRPVVGTAPAGGRDRAGPRRSCRHPATPGLRPGTAVAAAAGTGETRRAARRGPPGRDQHRAAAALPLRTRRYLGTGRPAGRQGTDLTGPPSRSPRRRGHPTGHRRGTDPLHRHGRAPAPPGRADPRHVPRPTGDAPHAPSTGWSGGCPRAGTPGSARTRRSLAKQPDRAFGQITATRPGEWVQIDSTPLDVRVVLDDGTVDRVELAGLVDQATHGIQAAVLRPTTKAVDAALLLAHALTPEPMRAGLDRRAAVVALGAAAPVADRDRRPPRPRRRAPRDRPESIVYDHGKAYLSATFRTACRTLGINLQPAHPDTPTDKPIIESTLGLPAGHAVRPVRRRLRRLQRRTPRPPRRGAGGVVDGRAAGPAG